MSDIDRVRQICKDRGIPIYKLERDLGFSNGYLNPKKASTISHARLIEISRYLNVSVEQLTGEETKIPAADNGDGQDKDEMTELLQSLRERPDLKMLFDAGRKATPDTVRATAQFLEDLAKKNEYPD